MLVGTMARAGAVLLLCAATHAATPIVFSHGMGDSCFNPG
jgi:hypothetical protein